MNVRGAALLLGMLLVPPGPERAFAQEGSPGFRRFGLGDGLSQESAQALVQDRTGFLWVGTQNGLDRWDGTSFRHFGADPSDSTSLADGNVRHLFVDSRGTLWVGTRSGGLHSFDPATGSFVRHGPGGGAPTEATSVRDVVEDPSGGLWVATGAGLLRFDPRAGKTSWQAADGQPGEGPPDAQAVTFGPDGRLWAGYADGTVRVLELSPEQPGSPVDETRLRVGGSVEAIRAFGPDSIFVGTSEGLHRFDEEARAVERVRLGVGLAEGDESAELWVNALTRDRDGVVWVATREGLVRLGPDAPPRRHAPDPTDDASLPHAEVLSLLEDRTGVLWVGTWGGLASLSPFRTAIHRYPRAEEPPGGPAVGSVVAITEDADGVLWLGTMDGKVRRLDRARRTVETLSQSGTASVFSLAFDGGDRLWVGTVGAGAVRLDVRTGVRESIPLSTPTGNGGSERDVVAVHVDRGGRVWAGTVSSGLQRLDPETGRFRVWRSPDGAWSPAGLYVWPVLEDSVGNLWFGSQGSLGGVHRIDPGRRRVWSAVADPGTPVSSGHTRHTGFPDGRVLTLHPAADGHVWVGTQGGGLIRLDPETGETKVWLEEDGLPHNTVASITTDDAGGVWIGTNDGLARFDPDAGRFQVLREASGVQRGQFYANSVFRNGRGELFFGGKEGLNVVRPELIRWPDEPPPVVLTRISLMDREIPPGDVIEGRRWDLGHDENTFTFHFAALDFTDPTLNRYRYRLEGLDPDWIDNGSSGVAVYRSVPPGHYELRVQARNSAGVWNEAGITLPLAVHPPYYETWWFRLLVLMALGGVLAAAYTYRTREKLRIQELRLGIAGKLHDDVGANLSAIALRSEMVKRISGLDDDVREKLGDVGRLARETARSVRETVWVVNTDYDTLDSLVAKMRDTADDLLGGDVDLSFSAPERLPEKPIPWELRQDVFYLFKEALHNALKHSGASEAAVEIAWDAPQLTLVVEDDGEGFDIATAERGSGLNLMRKRATRHGGRLDIRSRNGSGTRVELRIDVR